MVSCQGSAGQPASWTFRSVAGDCAAILPECV